MSESPESRLWDVMRGFMATQALYVAASLGVADALAAGPCSASDLATRTGADADALGRFLRALATEGVFAEHEPGVFTNTPASELLRVETTWHDFALLFGDPWYRAFDGSLHAARTGDETFARVYGTDWWTWLAGNPEFAASFNRAMAGERKAERLDGVEWRGDETVVDVGGGNGALLIELLRGRPGLRGVVLDLPEVAREAEERIAEAGLGDRIDVMPGSFFDWVPEGDVYVLSTVLHDWDDAAASTILRTIRVAAPEDVRVLVLDAVIAPGNEPDGAKWLDLLMLVLNRGRERTEPEWRALLAGAGFEVQRIEDGLIECR